MKFFLLISFLLVLVRGQSSGGHWPLDDVVQEIDPPDADYALPTAEPDHDASDHTTLIVFGSNFTIDRPIDNTYLQVRYYRPNLEIIFMFTSGRFVPQDELYL